MGVRFTEEQQSVIDAQGSSLLVSAAAGSGKTAVLVERIIRLITEPDEKGNRTDIDRLLVVTFTRAAAQQMKERILDAVRARLNVTPEDEHLQRQETLLHNAQITTIDSFCQFVVRSHFHEIDLDPGCKVVDSGELTLLQQAVLEEVLEEAYASGDEDFLYFSEYFATGNNDRRIEDVITSLYRFAISMPWPEDWLRERMHDYDVPEGGIASLPMMQTLAERARQVLSDCRESLHRALLLINRPAGPYMYTEMIEADLKVVDQLMMAAEDYEALRKALSGIDYMKLSSKRDDTVSPELREAVKGLRNAVKKRLEELQARYYRTALADMELQMGLAARAVKTLCEMTIRFKERFDALKREENVIDFSDMEHLALSVLLQREVLEDGTVNIMPTATAEEYRAFFKEVMIDEYQDSNNVQEMLLSAVSKEADGNHNRFMVGDVKQSIYKFRLARPEIFIAKLNNTEERFSVSIKPDTEEPSPVLSTRRIDLHKNFRSRAGVLHGVNYIFSRIMAADLGGVAYDHDACLVAGNESYPETEEITTELLILSTEKQKAHAEEARLVAQRIREMVGQSLVTAEDGTLRPVRYADIVILLRATSGVDSIYKEELTRAGIPAYTETKTGYFSAQEVMVLLELLRIIDNPLQDISFVSAAHSFFGNLSDEELARIRAAVDSDISFYHDVFCAYAAMEDADAAIADKVKRFLGFLKDLREKSHYMTAAELLEEILTRTAYRAYCAALPAGEQRTANIDMLMEHAVGSTQNVSTGLHHFVQYMQQLNRYEVDFGEANTLDENADVVRIMSIHKSKGLEFPIVFVSGLSKEMNLQDSKAPMIADVDAGLGVHAIDLEERVRYQTLRRTLIADKNRYDSIGEELRVLYVAMTRAKEKLILTATDPGFEKTLKSIAPLSLRDEKCLSLQERAGAGSFYRLIMASLADHPAMHAFMEERGVAPFGVPYEETDVLMQTDFSIRNYRVEDLDVADMADVTQGLLRKAGLLRADADVTFSKETEACVERVRTCMTTPYPHAELARLFAKTTVTELKERYSDNTEERFSVSIVPDTAEPSPVLVAGVSPTTRGNAYHKVFELLDDTAEPSPLSSVTAWMQEQVLLGRMPQEYMDAVDPDDILTYLKSDLGRRMMAALKNGKLFRERPFVMGIQASRLDEALPETETVLIQGIIDAYFIEDGEIVIVDYKTDRKQREEDFIRDYQVQLDYYEEALRKITHLPVKEKLIYAVELGKVIELRS